MKISSFALLNIIQFLGSVNENLFKLLAAFFLIGDLGAEKSNTILAIIGSVYTIPFILFSNLGGVFADKFRKSQMIIVTRFLELACLSVGFFVFLFHLDSGPYVILFIMATLGAIFGPSKYGVIPELLSDDQILYGNSVIASFTFSGIIVGSAMASFSVWLTDSNYLICISITIFIALTQSIMSLFLPRTEVKNKNKKLRFFFHKELFESIQQMVSIPSLMAASIATAYFLFIAGFIQLNMIPYTMDIMHMEDITGGYFFLLTAVGVGLGSYFTNKVSKGVIHLGMSIYAGLGITVILSLLKWIFTPWWLIIIWMILAGFFGGIYLVPPQSYILKATPQQDRGRNFGTTNFLSYLFVLMAAIILYVSNTVMGFTPATSFFIVGVINLVFISCLNLVTRWTRSFK
ncbi:MFS transporter [Chlamydiales bacterium]|nr:MFS transporter [Chlamydiales bacterium]